MKQTQKRGGFIRRLARRFTRKYKPDRYEEEVENKVSKIKDLLSVSQNKIDTYLKLFKENEKKYGKTFTNDVFKSLHDFMIRIYRTKYNTFILENFKNSMNKTGNKVGVYNRFDNIYGKDRMKEIYSMYANEHAVQAHEDYIDPSFKPKYGYQNLHMPRDQNELFRVGKNGELLPPVSETVLTLSDEDRRLLPEIPNSPTQNSNVLPEGVVLPLILPPKKAANNLPDVNSYFEGGRKKRKTRNAKRKSRRYK